jgi:hypothetical protein
MSTVNYLTARSSNLAAFNTIQLNVSTLTGSTIQTTATATTSSIVVSTLTTRAATYSTLTGSTITTNSLVLSTLNGSTLTITGNVGIGTTNPSNVLDVRPVGTGDAPNYGISHYFPTTYSASVYASQLIASLRFKWYNDLWDIAGIRGGSSAWQSLAVRYNGTEFLTVGTGGNVGIGSTGPGYLLTVGATATPAANSAGTTVIQCNGNLNIYRNRLIFSGTPTDWNHCIYNNNHNLDNEGAWDGMKFNVYNGAWFRVGTATAAVPTTAMYINATGQVGIGAAFASASFHIHGDGTSYIMAQLNEIKIAGNGNSHWSIFGARSGHAYFSIANTSANIAIGSAGTDVLSITSSNNVGIGITNPSVPLQVNGSIVGSRMYSVSGSLTVGTSATNVYGMNGQQSGFINIYWGNGNALYFFQWISGITSTYLTQLAYNPGYGTVTLSWGGSGGTFITATANVSQTVWYVITFNT